MSGLRDLYQEVILDHGRRPRNFRALAAADRRLEGYNPLCGDRLTLFLQVDGDRIRDAAFQGSGCAISTASASLMTEAVKGRTVAEAEELFRAFQAMVTGQRDRAAGPEPGPTPAHEPGPAPAHEPGGLGKLEVFAGVGEFPARVKCATLAWHTLHGALAQRLEPVTTE